MKVQMENIIIVSNANGSCAVYVNDCLSALSPHRTDPYMIKDTLEAVGISSKVLAGVKVQRWPDRFERLEISELQRQSVETLK
jgi:hypothetical protein